MIHVKYFGSIAEKAQNEQEDIPFSDISLSELLLILEQKHQLEQLSFSVAVNQKIVQDDECMIKDNDTVALLPPFAGG